MDGMHHMTMLLEFQHDDATGISTEKQDAQTLVWGRELGSL